MALVRFLNSQADAAAQSSDSEIQVPFGTTILEAARAAGILIESPCNCAGTCGKCKVQVAAQSLPYIIYKANTEEQLLSQSEISQGIVLACRTEIQGDIDVTLIHRRDNKDVQILSDGLNLDVQLDSFIKKQYLPDCRETLVLAGGELLARETGDTTERNYGMVVDIGTTTLVLSLLNLNTGRELAAVSALNPQSLYAQDVLSRINFAAKETGLSVMYTGIIDAINAMIEEALTKTGISSGNIYDVVFSGNTCMLHLAVNTNPAPLGKYPYTPVIYGGNRIAASEHNLNVAPCAQLYLPPIISAYVGADITSGILAADLQHLEGTTLFVDIGTNGEMALAVDGQLTATSTAAGPAFEGMNIACGMRAAPGAIEKFQIKGNNSVFIKTIGNEAAAGICGSGLVDIVGELAAHKIIGTNGKFASASVLEFPLLTARMAKIDDKTIFRLQNNIYLSQKDVRQVQLAKGAIRAGIESLLAAKQLNANQVDRVYIAGSFGYHLNAASLIHIGLLPEAFRDKISFLGNTSKTGGQAFLLNQAARSQMADLVKTVEVLELATTNDFDKLFVKCLNF